MCGRYFIDLENDSELLRIVREAEIRLKKRLVQGKLSDTQNKPILHGGEIRPTDRAAILKQAGCHMYADAGKWGVSFEKKQIFLARLETILQKSMFSESMLYRRCVVPASGFYEWTHTGQKKKYYFTNQSGQRMYMAGIWQPGEDGEHFIIVTTEADDTMRPVHDRMPVVLDRQAAEAWLGDWQLAWQTADAVRAQLQKECCEEFEQLTLF